MRLAPLALSAAGALAALTPSTLADLQFAPVESVASVTSISRDLELVDLDGDGDLDLVAIDPDATSGVKVFQNDGTGAFTLAAAYPLTDWGQTCDVGDLDGDGDLDLIVIANHFAIDINTFFNDGAGAFTAGPVTALANDSVPSDLKVGDLDGDGHLDAVISNWNTDTLAVHTGDGTGAFGPSVTYPVMGKAFEIVVADFDGDLALDVAVSNFGGQPTYTIPGEVWVFRNDGAGGLAAPAQYVVGRGTWGVSAGDLDADGDLDLVATNRNTFDVSFLRNQGDGTFAASVETPVGDYPVPGRLADLDGDGALEFAVPSSAPGTSNSIHLLANVGGVPSPATTLFGGIGMYESTVGDVDGDGDVDLLAGVYEQVWLFRNETPQLDPLLLDVNHLVGGQAAVVGLSNATPFSTAFVGFSVLGDMPPIYLPVLDTTFALQAPLLLASGIPDGSGALAWSFPLAPSTAGAALWLQALQFQGSSPVVATQIN